MENRFVRVYSEKLPKPATKNYGDLVSNIEIIKDTDTGVLYCFASSGYSTPTMSPLIGPDGLPLIDKSE